MKPREVRIGDATVDLDLEELGILLDALAQQLGREEAEPPHPLFREGAERLYQELVELTMSLPAWSD